MDIVNIYEDNINSNTILKILQNGRVGIGMTPSTNLLEVNGTASKTAAGDWLANSDARLKKDIKQMDSKAVLDKMLALKGITYYLNLKNIFLKM